MRSLANMVEVMVVAYCRAEGFPLKGIPEDVLPRMRPKDAADG